MLSEHCDSIDFTKSFEKLDLILSAVEQFAGTGDKAFDDCFDKLIQLLDDNCRLGDATMSTSDIASTQNLDGSFCQCSRLKKKYTLIAAKRLISDSDSFLYSKQIKKLIEYFRRNDPDALKEPCFTRYFSL